MTDNGRLKEIIDAVLKPLRYASKDGFHNLANLKSLEPLISSLSAEAIKLESDPKLRGFFEQLKNLFIGFDSL